MRRSSSICCVTAGQGTELGILVSNAQPWTLPKSNIRSTDKNLRFHSRGLPKREYALRVFLQSLATRLLGPCLDLDSFRRETTLHSARSRDTALRCCYVWK